MSLLDLTRDNWSTVNRVEPDERAMKALLKQPALSYIQDLRQTIDQDPNFLAFHEQSVGLKIQNLLCKQGIFWDIDVFEKQFLSLVSEAVARVKNFEN